MNLKTKFLERVNKTDTCWNWNLFIKPNGYAQTSLAGKLKYVHRLSYEIFKGDIPEGLQIDHLCRNRKCVNPNHLEIVTPKQNTRRGLVCGCPSDGGYKKICKRGHLIMGGNIYWRNTGYGACRTCRRELKKIWVLNRRKSAGKEGR